jgi:hypothetical protein
MAKKDRKALPAVHVTDLSDAVASDAADDNPIARTRVAGFNNEVERLHRKYAELEEQLTRAQEENARLERETLDLRRDKTGKAYHLKRRTRALWTLCVTLEGKAAYGLAALPPDTALWWANAAQAAVGVITGGYLLWPHLRVVAKMSSNIEILKSDDTDTE